MPSKRRKSKSSSSSGSSSSAKSSSSSDYEKHPKINAVTKQAFGGLRGPLLAKLAQPTKAAVKGDAAKKQSKKPSKKPSKSPKITKSTIPY